MVVCHNVCLILILTRPHVSLLNDYLTSMYVLFLMIIRIDKIIKNIGIIKKYKKNCSFLFNGKLFYTYIAVSTFLSTQFYQLQDQLNFF